MRAGISDDDLENLVIQLHDANRLCHIQEEDEQPDYLKQRQTHLATLAQLHPAITIVCMPDTIHDIPLQRPQELTDILTHALEHRSKL